MAQTSNHLRDLLEKIKDDAEHALALVLSEAELRSLGWKWTACGHVKHFTRHSRQRSQTTVRNAKAIPFGCIKHTTVLVLRKPALLVAKTRFCCCVPKFPRVVVLSKDFFVPALYFGASAFAKCPSERDAFAN